MAPLKLLKMIAKQDPNREGIPETYITCTIDGAPRLAVREALQELIKAGYVQRAHPHLDITDEGLAYLARQERS